MKSRSIVRTAFGFALLAVSGSAALAQYPDRPIRLVTPFPPGGAVDVVTRLVTDKMAAELGKPFVIEAKAGAGGILATDTVAKADKDGYTLLITTPNHTINAALNPKLPYDTEKDLAPVSIFAGVPEVLVAHPSAPFGDFKDFIAYAKANPGKLNYSSAGIGTLPHITMELLLQQTGVKATHVPYRGAAPAMTDLLAGVVQLKLDTYATSYQNVEAGRLKMLAYAGKARSPLLPNVPTVAELGVPNYEGILWVGIMAPAGTPQAIIDRLAAAAAKAVKSPELLERFKKDDVAVIGSSPAEFAKQVAREIPEWKKVIETAGIKAE